MKTKEQIIEEYRVGFETREQQRLEGRKKVLEQQAQKLKEKALISFPDLEFPDDYGPDNLHALIGGEKFELFLTQGVAFSGPNFSSAVLRAFDRNLGNTNKGTFIYDMDGLMRYWTRVR